MTAVQVHQLTILSRQLTENLMSAAICAKEISLITQSLADASSRHSTVAHDNGRRFNKAPAVIRPLSGVAINPGSRKNHRRKCRR